MAGCPSTSSPESQPNSPAVSLPVLGDPAGATTRPDENRYMLIVQMRVVSVEVPVGTASGTEELWSYLDEEPVSAFRHAGLGRNGWRIGVARRDVWPDLARILTHMTGKPLQERDFTVIPSRPMHVSLKENQPIGTIFLSNEDQTLSGADYPPGDYLLTVTCTLDRDDPSHVMVTGIPQVRSTHRTPRFIRQETGMAMVAEPNYFHFRPLLFRMTIPSGNIVVIGPGAESRRPSSVGYHFLVHRKEGMEFETVLVLVPRVFAAPLR